MDPRREFRGQGLIDQALPGHPALARKYRRDQGDRKVRLAFRSSTRVSGVAMRLVFDLEPERREPGGQLLTNSVGHPRHGKDICAGERKDRTGDTAAHRKLPRSSTTWW